MMTDDGSNAVTLCFSHFELRCDGPDGHGGHGWRDTHSYRMDIISLDGDQVTMIGRTSSWACSRSLSRTCHVPDAKPERAGTTAG